MGFGTPELSGVYSWLCGWRQCNTSAIVLLGTLEDENLVLGIWMVLVSLSYRSEVKRSGSLWSGSSMNKEIVLRSTNTLTPEEGKHGVEMCGRHDKNGARGRSLFSGRTLPDGSAAPLATGDDAHWGQNKDVLHHFERQEDRKIREGNWMKLVEVLV